VDSYTCRHILCTMPLLAMLLPRSSLASAAAAAATLQVNAAVLRQANATPGLFVCHVQVPRKAGRAAATGRQQVAYSGCEVPSRSAFLILQTTACCKPALAAVGGRCCSSAEEGVPRRPQLQV